jgi:hypothetical protein
MNFWNFIYDKNELEKFYTQILKPLKDNETYLALSCARHKYVDDKQFKMKNTEVLDRKLIRHSDDFNKFERSILKLGIPENYYTNPDDIPYPFDSYVLYITINPRDMLKTNYQIINNFNKMMYDSFKSETEVQKSKRLDIVVMSEIQASIGSKYYLDIDIDIKNKQVASEQVNKFRIFFNNDDCLIPIETRGGFHLLLESSKIPNELKNSFHQKICFYGKCIKETGRGDIEFKSDSMVPIPGTIQGGFEVKIRDIKDF